MLPPAYLAMSDEDFLKVLPPDAPAADDTNQETPAKVVTEAAESAVTDNAGDKTDDVVVAGDEIDPKVDPKVEELVVEGKDVVADPTKPVTEVVKPDATGVDTKVVVDPKTTDKVVDKVADKPVDKTVETPPDYEGFYKRIMAPFKANGKMVEPKTPEEALSLMQMGANYTKKMQDLVPHRKALLMLEKSGLLDEGKLSYLIDLEKKNPEAIRKLIKDSGIDPMEIDTTTEPVYQKMGNHRVSDEETTFQAALDDMKSNQSGIETLQAINTDWDHASKDLLWKSPEVMQIIHQQRESGVYDRITTEMNRQRTMGVLSPTIPFLQAYKSVGDQLVASNAFADLKLTDPTAVHGTTPAVVTTRVATPKAVVVNNDRARAASSTRASAQTQKAFVNPLSLSDADFLKQLHARV